MRKYFLILFASLLLPILGECEDLPVYRGQEMEIVVPECSLHPESLRIDNIDEIPHFYLWNKSQNLVSYDYIQKIARIWNEQHHYPYYLVYGKEILNSDTKFGWEVIPFPKAESRTQKIWNQFKVIWRVGFGPRCSTLEERETIANQYQNALDIFAGPVLEIHHDSIGLKENDPFCNEAIIEKQYIYKGDRVILMYNYAPIEPHHFMIITKEHRPSFSELTPEEYLEASEIAAKLIKHYQDKGYQVAYLFHKSGIEAGQSVVHWHEHVIFPEPETEQSLGKNMLMMIVKKLIFNSNTILSNQELAKRVNGYREELQRY